jgi:hypothetical protein
VTLPCCDLENEPVAIGQPRLRMGWTGGDSSSSFGWVTSGVRASDVQRVQRD